MGSPSVVDFGRTARRLRWSLSVLGVAVLVAWLAIGLAGGSGLRLRLLGELVGWALLAGFVVEVVVVGGSAIAGMLRAGERGDRLAGSDVSLVPPQLRRRRR